METQSSAGGSTMNASFGLPPEAVAAVPETEEQRVARLRAVAEAEVARESDEQLLARLKAEARNRRAMNSDASIPTDTQGFPADYVRVEIFKGPNKQDPAYVPLGINGFVIKVPRGEEVILPRVFMTECLEHAIEDVTVQSQGGLITRPVHRFPFMMRGPATPDEYRAYQQSQRDKAARETALQGQVAA